MRLAIVVLLLTVLAPSGVLTSVLQENEPSVDLGPEPVTSWKWWSCGDEPFGVDVKSIDISPDPPKKGEELNVTVSGTVKTVIEEGAYALVKAKMGLIDLLKKEYDICDEARNSDLEIECPVQEGDYTITQIAQLPNIIPPQIIRVTVDAYTPDDDPLVCVIIEVDFRPHLTSLLKHIF